MTKKTRLEDVFNLPAMSEMKDDSSDAEEVNGESIDDLPIDEQMMNDIAECRSKIDSIKRSLPEVHDIDKADEELDSYANMALAFYDDLVSLTKGVEDRHAAAIATAAKDCLKTALDATSAKVDRKLNVIKLQLQKEKIDLEKDKLDFQRDKMMIENGGSPVKSTGEVLTVNKSEVLKQMNQLKKEEKTCKNDEK